MTREVPTGLTLWLLRVPNLLYRARLGFMLGNRFLMIEHRGRKSGRLHRTVVEVVGRSSDDRERFVVSGFGTKTDWYQNLLAGQLEAIWLGNRRVPSSVRFLDHVEAAGILARYERAHPRTARLLLNQLGLVYDGTDAGRIAMMPELPMVAFQPIR